MPKLSGMQLIEEIKKRQLGCTVIVTTGHGGVADAVQAMREAPTIFSTKPVDPQHLSCWFNGRCGNEGLADEVTALRQQLATASPFTTRQQKPAHALTVFELISQVAETTATVLIAGETGTGKEVIAQRFHAIGHRRSGRSWPSIVPRCRKRC